ncbi:REP-associated tyrosine transposase [Occallatibacter riparius]|uniref:Transposase n=1 Tax=Occallatibacter riparius TaxID=1002689 RepID=A0A9J7BP84_9BACT|nr:transposase [Occallatibacter riparius]UWZ82734.1 transposase [Occallatibacter riparius]
MSRARIFFATTNTFQGKFLLQSERNATLLIEVLRTCATASRFRVLDFVVMPNHLHLLVEVRDGMSIEKAMQLVKGGFSYLLKKEAGYLGEVWQKGYSEVRVMDERSLAQHRAYIAQNPVKAGLAPAPDEWPYCYA